MKTTQQSYPKLAEALGVPGVFLKREDLHKYGSHKGRAIPLMIKTYVKEGFREFVISSSGNAALAAIQATTQHNKNNPGKEITLTVYIGKNINEKKSKKLKTEAGSLESEVQIEQVDRPKQIAFQKEKEAPETVKFLRQSTDDLALEGYLPLAQELNKIENLQAIFIPTSSGTTAQAIAQGFLELEQQPQIHAVQTTACHPIASAFDTAEKTETSLASAIVDNIAHRKEKVVEAIKKSKGSAWIATDDEIKEARKLVREHTGIDISSNSALSIAGLKKAIEKGSIFDGPVACLITGA